MDTAIAACARHTAVRKDEQLGALRHATSRSGGEPGHRLDDELLWFRIDDASPPGQAVRYLDGELFMASAEPR
ncbi:hypothetical protein U9M48_008619 [Paspalum notatum var. saurae]|uniref:Uncharacterized protein n=1 Tax=Paspalum notatum var. saurae TaxID=547442 RepID=A0AAQ3SQ21_PASNO